MRTAERIFCLPFSRRRPPSYSHPKSAQYRPSRFTLTFTCVGLCDERTQPEEQGRERERERDCKACSLPTTRSCRILVAYHQTQPATRLKKLGVGCGVYKNLPRPKDLPPPSFKFKKSCCPDAKAAFLQLWNGGFKSYVVDRGATDGNQPTRSMFFES